MQAPLEATVHAHGVATACALQAGMHRHVAVLRELADLAARELVIEQAVGNISSAFMALRIQFQAETESGISGALAASRAHSVHSRRLGARQRGCWGGRHPPLVCEMGAAGSHRTCIMHAERWRCRAIRPSCAQTCTCWSTATT